MPITNMDRSKIPLDLKLSVAQAASQISRGNSFISNNSNIGVKSNNLLIPPADGNAAQMTVEQINSEFYVDNIERQLQEKTGFSKDILSSGGGFVEKFENPFSALEQTALQLSSNAPLLDILNSIGPKTVENNEFKYKIFIQFDGYDKNYYDDTLFFIVFRCAFIKAATIYQLRINLTPVLVEQIKLIQNSNKPVTLQLFIYTVQTDGDVDLKNPIMVRPLVLNHMKVITNSEIERGNSVMCDLLLSSKIAFNMNNTYSYNKVLNTKNTYDALLDYEKYISSTYGDSFETKHIVTNKNQHIYEQIVTKPTDQEVELPSNKKFTLYAKSDLYVPGFLNFKYKIDNSLSFYFYDSFNVKSKKEYVRYFISFGDKNKLEKFKIENQMDIVQQSQFTTSYPFYDPYRTITQENTVTTGKQINASYDTKKTQKSKHEKGTTQTGNKINIVTSQDVERFFYTQNSTITTQEIASSSNSNTYQVPDSTSNSEKRVEVAKKIFTKGIEKVDEFTTNNCGIDWLQFGILYPLNENRPNEYLHTPISIVNIFNRINSKENILGHMMRYQMIKFVADSSESDKNDNKTSTSNNKQDNNIQDSSLTSQGNNENMSETKTGPKTNKPQIYVC